MSSETGKRTAQLKADVVQNQWTNTSRKDCASTVVNKQVKPSLKTSR
jgi:hypothetical protein